MVMLMPNWARGFFAFLLGLTLMLGVRASFGATTILPPGETCFTYANGAVASGSVYMLTPNTTTPKNTWRDSGQATLNSNPIPLDANGCALIYGTGSYRQQVYTGPVVGGLPTGTLLYDVTTADTSSFQNVFWAGLSGGTANAITVTDAGFNNTDGSVINFLALNTNTGSATLNVSAGGAIAIKAPSASGPISLASGCIAANNPVSVVYSSSSAAFLLLTPCQSTAGTVTASGSPGGYLTLSSDVNNVVITNDQNAATTVYYSPLVHNQIPIWNGSSYTLYTFGQLTLTLNASVHLADTIYDICAFINSGAVTLATGPAWSNSALGTGARGTGAGSSQLQRQNGLWVNAVAITGNNGGTTYSIAAEQCTYLGSILIDHNAGQVTSTVSFGQNRKLGVWNYYNRQNIIVQAGDTTVGGWVYSTGTIRASNNNPATLSLAACNAGGTGTCDSIILFEGVAEDAITVDLVQAASNEAAATANASGGIGLNTITAFSSAPAFLIGAGASAATNTIGTTYLTVPSLGANAILSLEKGSGTATRWYGTAANQMLKALWRG